MSGDLVIALDLGTSSCKAVAVDARGGVAASASGEYALRSPRPGSVEQDAGEVWRAAAGALREAASRVERGRLAGVALSGAMHSLLALDERGEPMGAASTWADTRAAETAERLRREVDAKSIYERTGCPVQAIYHPARLRWLREDDPRAAAISRFVALKDFVLHGLTGEWKTDAGLASTTGLLDIRRLEWDAAALELARVRPDQLPALVSPADIAGTITAGATEATGLPKGLPVIAGGSDGAMANLAACGLAPGLAVITVGTSGAIRVITDEPRLDPRERTWCYVALPAIRQHGPAWLVGGAINNGGLTADWVRRLCYGDLPEADGFDAMDRDAGAIPPGAEGLTLVPYFTGERSPRWAPHARASVHGLTISHGRAHLARAAAEAVAFCLADVWEAAASVGIGGGAAWLTGGITRSPPRCQVLADVLGLRLTAIDAGDASALGAARLGHLALGHIGSLPDAPPSDPAAVAYEPDSARHARYRELHRRFQSLAQAFAPRP